ncbi:hypothetical protein Geob_0978 [Geotalea daltonii FRC-32]|uniref:Uncharacterized protein n=1 Tax=Geotalea daltonii (strain DSM 22248 / JCM 15807 / FRC-32) TaxID=316067 RepID=B9M2G1_GEODF|nr:hypothetical protein Geob_0978 [Geotalea daltonii FRC-32]
MELSEKKFLGVLIALGITFMPFIIFHETGSVSGSLKVVSVPLLCFLPVAWLAIKFNLYEMTEFSKKYSKLIGYLLICILMLVVKKIPHLIQIYLVLFALFCICLGYYLKFIKRKF